MKHSLSTARICCLEIWILSSLTTDHIQEQWSGSHNESEETPNKRACSDAIMMIKKQPLISPWIWQKVLMESILQWKVLTCSGWSNKDPTIISQIHRTFHKSQDSTSPHWHFYNLILPFHAVFRCSCGGSTLVDSHDFHHPPDTSWKCNIFKAEVWQVGLVCLLSVAFHGFTSEKNMEKHQSSGNLVTEIDSQHRQNEGKTKWLQK